MKLQVEKKKKNAENIENNLPQNQNLKKRDNCQNRLQSEIVKKKKRGN